ncbi:COP9 signalosome complex-related / CSN complex-like protein [Arabidopsis thaliana]|uniref:COP9 signalosome complex-related / CSN complex-like protein n=1 Tax=Arabidopsis thaliana TaxID=3702 RepID=F4JAZ8_ARATH|nr:COP9 signalosome complex-related / CSN complex-like protein [Arabidopsis thaliana]AEE75253.1 COP9 signalosome complex-related / CSN complex-like protein [Arabidopsis thaliana]|eukprot:NP_187891.1 COP9 signalosome complex-related / CSN complex-like protein [Arabidopsis thaliana]
MDIEGDDQLDLDVEAYSRNYEGRNLVLRLLHIAENSVGPMFTDDLELEALRLAYDLIRNDGIVCDMRLFTVIAEKIQGRLGEGYLLDEKWRLTKNNNFVKQDSILRNDLESATDELEKDRLALRQYWLHYHCGQMAIVFRPYPRQVQTIDAYMATLLVALETRNFGELPHRSVEQIAYCNVKRAYGFKIDCFKSLSNLLESKYQVTAEGNAVDTIVNPIGQVASHLENVIKPFGPCDYLIDVIKKLLAGHFTDCMTLLEKQRPRLLLDFYLRDHVDNLLSMMRDGGRLRVDSGGMVITESQVKRLMLEGKIKGRIEGQVFCPQMQVKSSEIDDSHEPPPCSVRSHLERVPRTDRIPKMIRKEDTSPL